MQNYFIAALLDAAFVSCCVTMLQEVAILLKNMLNFFNESL